MAVEPRMRTAHKKDSTVLLRCAFESVGKFLKVLVKRVVSAILALKCSDTNVLCGKKEKKIL